MAKLHITDSPENRQAYSKAVRTWSNIHWRCQFHPSYSDIEVRMTFNEWINWAFPQYRAWMDNRPGEIASLDRINTTGHYEITNLQIISTKENSRKPRRSANNLAPKGAHWCSRCQAYLPLEMFGKNPSNRASKAQYCKGCFRVYNAKRNALHPSEITQDHSKRLAAPENEGWCRLCKKYLPTSAFYKDKLRAQGITHECKVCYTSLYRQKKPLWRTHPDVYNEFNT